MNFLASEEIRYFAEEEGLIDPPPDEETLIEDIKCPIRFGGETVEHERDDEGNYTEKTHKNQDSVAIPPREYRVLKTRESINTAAVGAGLPIHAVGFVYVPNSFVRRGLHPCFQGLIDTGWDGGRLRITLHNGNSDTRLIIERGDRIAYVFFTYVQSTKPVTETISESQITGPGIEEADDVSSLRESVSGLRGDVEELQEKHRRLRDRLNGGG